MFLPDVIVESGVAKMDTTATTRSIRMGDVLNWAAAESNLKWAKYSEKIYPSSPCKMSTPVAICRIDGGHCETTFFLTDAAEKCFLFPPEAPQLVATPGVVRVPFCLFLGATRQATQNHPGVTIGHEHALCTLRLSFWLLGFYACT